ncbi:hypothetical protein C8Q75DRAFT_753053 [Abortiporus biennis]|nr:hypothetical protein C8Q75DRAFT_753053 [Abortiporus biennis]
MSIPPELTDRIIDYLYDDFRTLSMCALSSRTFIPAVRYHQFGFITLDGQRLTSFNSLLDTNPHLGHLVSTVIFQRLEQHRRWNIRRQDSDQMVALIKRTPLCQRLDMINVDVESDVVQEVIHKNSIQTLVLKNNKFDTIPDFLLLISSFPLLKNLEIEHPTFIIEGTPMTHYQPTSFLKALTTRQFSNRYAHSFIRLWLLNAQPSFVLNSYHTELDGPVTANFANNILAAIGNVISELSINVIFDTLEGPLQENNFSIRNCTNLRRFEMRFNYYAKSNSGQRRPLAWIPKLLSEMSSTVVDTIQITLYSDEDRELMEDPYITERRPVEGGTFAPLRFRHLITLDWNALNDILLSQRYQSLRRLTFKGKDSPNTCYTFLNNRYPRIAHLIKLEPL